MKRFNVWYLVLLGVLLLVFTPGTALPQDQEKEKEQEVSEEELMELLGMTVEAASKKEESIMDAPAIISVINSAEIRELGIQTVAEAVGLLAGVFKYDEITGMYNLFAFRGFFVEQQYSSKLLFLVNGHPIFLPLQGAFEVNMIPIEAVERIEVIRGPVSVMYGTNAIIGVINIVTKREPTFLNGEISYRYGSFGTHELRASLGKNYGDYRYFISGSYKDEEGYDVFGTPEQDEAGIGFEPHKHYVDLKNLFLNLAYKNLEIDVAYWKQNNVPKLGMIANSMFYGGTWEMDYLYADLRYAQEIADNATLNFKLRLDSAYLAMLHEEAALQGAPQPGGAKNDKIGTEIYADTKLSEKLSLLAGVMHDRYHTSDFNNILFTKLGFSFSFFKEDTVTSDTAAYANFSYQATDRVDLVGGLRYTDNSITGGHGDYRLGSIFYLSDDVSVKLLYGTSHRSPVHDELYTDGFPLIMGNINLDFETLKGLDLGINYKYENKLLASVNYYWSRIENSINLRPVNFIPTYINIEGQELQGLEFELKYRPSRTFSFFMNSSHILSSKDLELETELYHVLTNMFNFGFSYKPIDSLTIGCTNIWRDKWLESESFFLSNLSLLYTLPVVNPGVELFVIANNLFDKEYTWSEYKNQLVDTIPGGPPRCVTAGIILSF